MFTPASSRGHYRVRCAHSHPIAWLVTLALFAVLIPLSLARAAPASTFINNDSASMIQRPESAERFIPANTVELWKGTVQNNQTGDSTTITFGVIPGLLHESSSLYYDLKVDQEGFVYGTVDATLNSYSFSQEGSVCALGFIFNCSVSHNIVNGKATAIVEGRRDNNSQGQPVLTLTNIVFVDTGTTHSSTSGSVLGISSFHLESDNEWTPSIDSDWIITPYSLGRPPLAKAAHACFSNLGGWAGRSASCTTGELQGMGKEPLIEVDPELMQNNTFLSGISLDDRLDGTVDWNSASSGWVTWQTVQRNAETIGPTRAHKVPKHVDVGGMGVGTTTLNVQAHNSLGYTSRPATTQLRAVNPPTWSDSAVSGVKIGSQAKYTWEKKFPAKPFTGIIQVWNSIPFFGGNNLGIRESQFTGRAEWTSGDEGTFYGKAASGFEATGSVARLQVEGKGTVALGSGDPTLKKGEFQISGGGLFKKTESLLKAVPSFNAVLNVISSVSPEAAVYIASKAQAKLEFQPMLGLLFKFHREGNDLQFDQAQIPVTIGFKVSAVLEAIKDAISVTIGVGGELKPTFQVPEPYFKDVTLKFLVWAEAQLWHFGSPKAENAWTFTYPSALSEADATNQTLNQALSGEWHLLDRSYETQPNYAQWTGAEKPQRLSTSPLPQMNAAPSDYGVTNYPLLQNVFQQAHPALAADSHDRILVWAHDEPGSPPLSSQDLMFSTACSVGCQTLWDTPQAITHDNLADFNPQVALIGAEKALVVWERFDSATPGDFNIAPRAYLSHVQIAASCSCPFWPNFSAPQQLSTGGSLNYQPQVAALGTGGIAVWINNPSNQILGSSAKPDNILFAQFNGTSWTPTAPVVANLAGLLGMSLATNGDQAALVYVIDTDGNLTTDADRELYYTRYMNNSWIAPTRLTNNSLPDSTPQLALASNGTPLLVWRQAEHLKFLSGSWSATAVDLTLDDAGDGNDLRLTRSDSGNLALVWQHITDSDARVGYAAYDAVTHTWSDARSVAPPQITGTTPGATAMVLGLTPALVRQPANLDQTLREQLSVGYQLATMESITHTVNGLTIPNVPEPGTHSLNLVEIPFGVNLAITPSDLSASPTNARAGDPITVSAVVHNSGELAVQNVTVVLNAITPGADLGDNPTYTRLITRTLNTVSAGQAVTVTFPTTRPADGSHGLFVCVGADPSADASAACPVDFARHETSSTDNSAELGTGLSITNLGNVYTSDSVNVNALITQSGAIYSRASVTVSLRLEDPNGPEVAFTGASFPVTPTASITVSAYLSPSILGTGRHTLYWVLDPGNQMGDLNRDTKLAGTAVSVLPDLTTDAARVGFGHSPGNSAPFSLRVENHGNLLSHGGRALVLDGVPGSAGAHTLLSLPLPDIQVSAGIELTGSLNLAGLPSASTGLSSIYVQLDPDNTVDELNENNNVVQVGGELGGSFASYAPFHYFPMQVRGYHPPIPPTPTPAPTTTPTPRPDASGIAGHLTVSGQPAVDVSLRLLRLVNGVEQDTGLQTHTNNNGNYLFSNVPAIQAGQGYQVAFDNDGSFGDYVGLWRGVLLSSYSVGMRANGGDFDLRDVAPSDFSDETQTLPRDFVFQPRGIAGDRYSLDFLDDSGQYLQTYDARTTGSPIHLPALPAGLSYDTTYTWGVRVINAGGYAVSQYQPYVVFSH